jgi:hypothetical protein
MDSAQLSPARIATGGAFFAAMHLSTIRSADRSLSRQRQTPNENCRPELKAPDLAQGVKAIGVS